MELWLIRRRLSTPKRGMIETKQQALNLFEATRLEFLEYARWVAKRIAEKKGHVTIDDIRGEISVPLNLDGRVLGAVFNTPEWEKVGYSTTKIKSSHGRFVSVWHLKGKELLEQFDRP